MRRLWFTFLGPGGRWRVYLAPPSHPALRCRSRRWRVMGYTRYDERAIYVSTAETRAEQDATALHELMHAALTGQRVPAGIEERVVRRLDAPLLPVLQQLGLRLPPRPRTPRRKVRR